MLGSGEYRLSNIRVFADIDQFMINILKVVGDILILSFSP